MAKITKRTLDALKPEPDRDVFTWDGELRGFGIRVKPSGVKTFLIQYRNTEGRTRRLVLGQYGAVTPEIARDLARKKLTAVANGEDPSAERHAIRVGVTVAEVCDWYLEQAESGRILGRNRRPIKASTLHMDRSRIETHIKPLLGSRMVSGLTLRDIEGMQADIAVGKIARGKTKGRGGRSTGGTGVASRTIIGTLRGLLGHAARLKIIGGNPAPAVRGPLPRVGWTFPGSEKCPDRAGPSRAAVASRSTLRMQYRPARLLRIPIHPKNAGQKI